MNDFNGFRVFITGATGQLGSQIVKQFINAGASVACWGRNEQKLNQLVGEVEAQSGSSRCVAVYGSVQSQQQADELIGKVEQTLGHIDICVNCMGNAEDKPFIFHDAQDVSQSLQANLFPMVRVCQSVSQHMIARQQGSIVNISSITGMVGQPMRSLYGASKSAVIAYSKSLARRIAVHGVNVNCLAPQVVAGGLATQMNPLMKQTLESLTPVPRECTADDLVAPIFMLAKQSGGFITGEVIKVTGGLITW